MRDYYELLGINSKKSADKIAADLRQERKKWATRQNAPDMEKRQLAEQKLELINEAMKVLSTKEEKEKYDRALRKAKKKGTVEQETEATTVSMPGQAQAADILITLAEEAYNSGNSEDAIHACGKALQAGFTESKLYYIMGLSYLELGDMNHANSAFREGISNHPEDYELMASFARILSIYGNEASAMTYISLLKDQVPDHYLIPATMFELQLIKGNLGEADRIYQENAPKYISDRRFAQEIANAYERYEYRVVDQGYFENEQQLNQVIDVAEKHTKLDASASNHLKLFQNQKKVKFDWSNWKGVVFMVFAAFVLAYGLFTTGGVLPILGAVAVVGLAGWLLSLNRKPVWKLERKRITGKKDAIDYLYVILGAFFVILWWIMRWAYRISEDVMQSNMH